MSTDLIAHGNRKRSPAISAKIKVLAELLATTPGQLDYAALAKASGYRNAHDLRQAMKLPQNVRLRDYKRQVLDDICMHNPERLRRIADAEGGNAMAKVAAVRALELMQGGEQTSDLHRTAQQSAGITIVIESGASARVLNPPTIEHDPVPHVWPSVD